MRCEHEFGRRLDTPLFSDAGMIPGGDLWVCADGCVSETVGKFRRRRIAEARVSDVSRW